MATDVKAAPGGERVLNGIQVVERGANWELLIQFSTPVRILGHTPQERGSLVEVRVHPIRVESLEDKFLGGRQSLRLPKDLPLDLVEVTYEGDAPTGPVLLVRFPRSRPFSVHAGGNDQSVLIRLPKASAKLPKPLAKKGIAAGRAPNGNSTAVMEEARRAMADADYARAIQLYTIVLSGSENTYTPEAMEYLGLAHQRKGQLAHARAEYEAYLERYPKGEGAVRVRQSLDALLTARAEPVQKLRPVKRRDPSAFDLYGSFYTGYYRAEEIHTDLSDSELRDSSQIAQLDLTGLMRKGDYELRTQFDGFYHYDFMEREDADDARVGRLFVEATDRGRRLRGSLGRQSSNGGGVLGRFDGAALDWGFTEHWKLGAVAGYPFDSAISNSTSTDRSFVGLNLQGEDIVKNLDAEFFTIAQEFEGFTDRRAVGGSMRYFATQGSLLAYLDYDYHYASLNLALISGQWNMREATQFTFLVEHRNNPFLTTRNALIGQPVGSLDDLKLLYTTSEIEKLAEDRTSESRTLSLGGSQVLSPRWRLSGDFTATDLSKTSASGGVPEGYGTDWNFIYFVQLSGNDLLMQGDAMNLGFRIFDAENWNSYAFTARGRYAFSEGWRVTPLLWVEYRDNEFSEDFVNTRPSLRLEYRWHNWVFDTDLGLEWIQALGGGTSAPISNSLGYIFNAGVRVDF
jgi:tetratricopeptide (TPR) repeat protein